MIGEKIKTLRKLHDLTQVELSEKLKTTQPVLQKWETGIKNPSLRTLKKISKIFDVSLDTLAFDDKDFEKLKIKDKSLLSKLKYIEKLNDKDKEMIINLINSLSEKNKSGN